MIFNLTDCEQIIGYEFKDKMLLRQCFTHSSYANEHKTVDNELLEFFGDSIIEFVVTEYLYKNQYGDEGDLTKLRAEIVSKEPLLKVVYKLGLDQFLLMGVGQEKTSQKNEKMFSSIYEALVAGIYLDGGMVHAKRFIVKTLIQDFIESKAKKRTNKVIKKVKDSKSLLQEYVQSKKIGSVSYQSLSKLGPDHMPEFREAVIFNGDKIAEGKGQSKKIAQQKAAESALIKLKQGWEKE